MKQVKSTVKIYIERQTKHHRVIVSMTHSR